MKAFVLMNTINEPILAPPTLWNAQTGRLPYMYSLFGKSYMCWLCSTFVEEGGIEAHCQEICHLQVLEHMKADWYRIMLAEFRLLNTNDFSHAHDGARRRASQLDRESWRSRVPANFLRQLSSPDRRAQLSYALYDLARFDLYESMVLLDLAVWKAVCLLQIPTASLQDFYSAQKWIKTGWKACKARQRPSNAMTIVVRAVRPYLS